jgi:hypothetical protein
MSPQTVGNSPAAFGRSPHRPLGAAGCLREVPPPTLRSSGLPSGGPPTDLPEQRAAFGGPRSRGVSPASEQGGRRGFVALLGAATSHPSNSGSRAIPIKSQWRAAYGGCGLMLDSERFPTAYALAVLAQEEFAKALLLNLVRLDALPWSLAPRTYDFPGG